MSAIGNGSAIPEYPTVGTIGSITLIQIIDARNFRASDAAYERA